MIVNEPAKLAAEFSPGRKPGDHRAKNDRAREAGDRTYGKLCRPLRGLTIFCGLIPGFRSLRSLHPGLNSAVGSADWLTSPLTLDL